MPTIRQALAVTAVTASMAVSACTDGSSQANESAHSANAAEQQVVPRLPIPTPEPPLGRDRLLIAALQAASDFAAGIDDSARQSELANKKFEFRIRFGCGDPSAGAPSSLGWALDEKRGTLKVRATPTLSKTEDTPAAIAGEAYETVEGFWVRKPWMLSATCPRPAEQAQVAPADGEPQRPQPDQLVGIGQFFTSTDPRTMRRSGRAYEATKNLEAGDRPAQGFDLVLTGRLAALPDGRVIACTGAPGDGRPACIVSVEFGKVSIERADTHEQMAQWGSG